jgi:two-component system, sensor histidine kinase
MAEIATDAKGCLLAMVAHDLRQPLQVVGAALDLIGRKVPPGAVDGHLESAWKAINTIEWAVDLLLAASRIESPVEVAKVQIFPLQSTFDEIEEQHRTRAEAKGLRLRISRSSAIVRSDPRLLASILQNLVGNAIKYTDRGSVLIGCRRRLGSVDIQVLDTGSGIPCDRLGAAFQAFTRLDPARGDGMGLGLSIVRRCADALGHRLSVHSVPGRGSRFCIEVPRSAAAAVSI